MTTAAIAATAPPAHAADAAAERPLDAAALRRFGSTLVVAPHPDDETLGCGGLLALLHDAGQRVTAVLVTDGSQSHPGSRRFDAAARGALRIAEWQAALDVLGVPPGQRHRLGLADGAVPAPGAPGFAAAADALAAIVDAAAPATVVLAWRRDPHPDHRSAHALALAAIGLASARHGRPPPRLLEYGVWLDERGSSDDRPRPGEARAWRLDIAAALERKLRALERHRSQLGAVIDDDPGGFRLGEAMLRRAGLPHELLLEVLPPP